LLLLYNSDIIITSLSQKEGENMIKNLFKRIKSQKGMSGVLVALLLVIVGVGLVAGVNIFMTGAQKTLIKDANDTITTTAAAAVAP